MATSDCYPLDPKFKCRCPHDLGDCNQRGDCECVVCHVGWVLQEMLVNHLTYSKEHFECMLSQVQQYACPEHEKTNHYMEMRP